jgi:hypothetical protein
MYRSTGPTPLLSLLFPLHKHQFLLPAFLRTRIIQPPRTTILPTRKNQYSPPLHPRPLQCLFPRSWPLFPILIPARLLGLPHRLLHIDRLPWAQLCTRRRLEHTNEVGHELKLEDPLPACAARRRRSATNSARFRRRTCCMRPLKSSRQKRPACVRP